MALDATDKLIGDLKRIANGFHFTATRVGMAGCDVRKAAQHDEQTMQDAIALIRKLTGKTA